MFSFCFSIVLCIGDGGSSNGGAIAGGIIGAIIAVVLIVLIIILIVWLWRFVTQATAVVRILRIQEF